MLFIEAFIFPADLITAWPSLDNPVVTFEDNYGSPRSSVLSGY